MDLLSIHVGHNRAESWQMGIVFIPTEIQLVLYFNEWLFNEKVFLFNFTENLLIPVYLSMCKHLYCVLTNLVLQRLISVLNEPQLIL